MKRRAYYDLIESLPLIVLEVDRGGNLIFVNRAGLEALGAGREELCGRLSVLEFISEGQRPKARISLRRILAGKESGASCGEYELQTRDGGRLSVVVHSTLVARNGGADTIRVVVEDITELKLCRSCLEEMEAVVEDQRKSTRKMDSALRVLLDLFSQRTAREAPEGNSGEARPVPPMPKETRPCRAHCNTADRVELQERKAADVRSHFMSILSLRHPSLSRTEMRVAGLVGEGRTTKEVAALLGVSPVTIEYHRNNMRKKLGLNGLRKERLAPYLLALLSRASEAYEGGARCPQTACSSLESAHKGNPQASPPENHARSPGAGGRAPEDDGIARGRQTGDRNEAPGRQREPFEGAPETRAHDTEDVEKKRIDARFLETEESRASPVREDECNRARPSAVGSDIMKLVSPYLRKLWESGLTREQASYLSSIESGLKGMAFPSPKETAGLYSQLTAAEVRIADMIRTGKTSKEIATLLYVSEGTVNGHRNNIRKKLGLGGRKISLHKYLRNFNESAT